MPTDHIPFRDTGFFSTLICDYLDEKEELKAFFNRFPKTENFSKQIEEKGKNFPQTNREILEQSLLKQYGDIDTSERTAENIRKLTEQNTFTITTGHQLNLFTGPVYFIYKIVSAINLCKELSVIYPENRFVPVYWMASEDHDFEEINYFNFKGKKVNWTRESGGAVGRFSTDGLEVVSEVLSSELGLSSNAKRLDSLFKQAYTTGKTLAQATRYLVNEIFGDHGLLIVDGDDIELKRLFIPYIKNEILKSESFSLINESSTQLKSLNSDYKIQVNPREVNLFYIHDGIRERIISHNGNYLVFQTDISWNGEEISKEIEEHPERFSPNVVLRPLYQEVILPNLCYIGGGGELAYWLQLKSNFDHQRVCFPMLLLRNSVLIYDERQAEKANKLELSIPKLFKKQEELIKEMCEEYSKISIDFSPQIEHLKAQFKDLHDLATKTDRSFEGAVAAQEHKQIKGLKHLEKRLLKAQKRKLKDRLDRIRLLQNELFPNGSLQERQLNFAEFYLEHGDRFIEDLFKTLDPLKGEFSLIKM